MTHEPDYDRLFATPRVDVETRGDGNLLLSNPNPVKAASRCVGDWLVRQARDNPDNVFLAERSGERWRQLTYRAAHAGARAIATRLLREDLSAQRPLVILSDNSIDHGLLALGALHAGVPFAPISTEYALLPDDHFILSSMIKLLSPGAIYVSNSDQFAPALQAIDDLHNATLIASRVVEGQLGPIVPFYELLADTDAAPVDQAFAALGPDTIAKFLFTSGSTGAPKAVINTHAMLCINQEQRLATWPFLADVTPNVVDWLPWSHALGGNHNFAMILRFGGTLYIDQGRPSAPLFATTVENIKKVRPNISFNVPRGYAMLVDALREDEELRVCFFENLKIIFTAAAIPQNLWYALIDLSTQTLGRALPIISGYGTTETGPLATDCYFKVAQSGNIGLPNPGVELKLVGNGDKQEMRIRAPNVTPGYWKQPDVTAQAFDSEGFFITGDAVRFADPQRPEAGLYFDGRISEDFKLSTGTWVSTGELRIAGLAALEPLAQDIVVAGENQQAIGFLIFPNLTACRSAANLPQDTPVVEVLAHPSVRQRIKQSLEALHRAWPGSSRHADRARLLEHPPSLERGEITDKAYLNQRAVLANRQSDVDALFGHDATKFVALNDP